MHFIKKNKEFEWIKKIKSIIGFKNELSQELQEKTF